MESTPARSLAEVITGFPEACYANPTWKGVLWLLRDLVIYSALVVALIRFDDPLLLLVLWPLTALAIAGLFILGHDAAHGALFRSSTMNAWLGQLAMLPALHLYQAWIFGHNRIHHAHTTRQGMDYVWHPLTPEQYGELDLGGRLRHQLMWSWLGGGIYYLYEIWWKKMICWKPPGRIRDKVRKDRIVVGTYALFASTALLVLGLSGGGAGGALWTWIKVFGIPFLLWNYVMGITVYVHHIAPDILWRRRRVWTKHQGQLEGTTVLRVSRFINLFMHNIFLHVPHHVDVRIPFYGLPRAVEALRERHGDVLRQRPYRIRDYVRTTRACKLFDFDRGIWSDYHGVAARLEAISPTA